MATTLKIAATSAADERLASDGRMLDAYLGQLFALLSGLVEVAERKLAALRRAQVAELEECTAREGELLQQVRQTEQQRRAVLARFAQRLPDGQQAAPNLQELAVGLPEPISSSLRARSAGVRHVATVLQEKNRLAARVAHDLQSHLHGIFADLRKVNSETVVYGAQGEHKHTRVRSLVDAVG